MSADRKQAPRLLPQVLLRVLPVAVLVLFTTWYGIHRLVNANVQTELVEKLEREAEFGAETIAARLDTLFASMRAVARNDLVVNSLVDRVSREAYVPTFMQSLTLPGPKGAKVTFTDYRGRLIASNSDDIGRSDYFLSGRSVDGIYMRVDDTGATFAVPVLYDGRQEGAIVVRYNQLHLQELLAVNSGTDVSAVYHGEQVLQSSNWAVALPTEHSAGSGAEDCVIHGVDVPGYAALRYVVAEPIDKAFATANRIQRTDADGDRGCPSGAGARYRSDRLSDNTAAVRLCRGDQGSRRQGRPWPSGRIVRVRRVRPAFGDIQRHARTHAKRAGLA